MVDVIRFSANLGFLWTDRPLPDAIVAAAAAGFDAVECHMPYSYDPTESSTVLRQVGLPMVGMNTDHAGPEFGLAAVPGREVEARDHIDKALAYATTMGCPNVNLMAGRTGRAPGSENAYRSNLAYAAERASAHGCTLLLEPISTNAIDGYHLNLVGQAMDAIKSTGADEVKVMVDCFHTHDMEGDVLTAVRTLGDRLGHIQIAAHPDRGEPDAGDLDYTYLLPAIMESGYEGFFGAEYRPRGDLEAGLTWMNRWRQTREMS